MTKKIFQQELRKKTEEEKYILDFGLVITIGCLISIIKQLKLSPEQLRDAAANISNDDIIESTCAPLASKELENAKKALNNVKLEFPEELINQLIKQCCVQSP